MPRMRLTVAGLLLVLAAATLVALAGCKGVTPIKSLLDDPSQYAGKIVRIAGRVTSSTGILGYGVYKVEDGTGVMTVVTQVGGSPRDGANVVVEGTVKTAFTLGTDTGTVLVETERKTQ